VIWDEEIIAEIAVSNSTQKVDLCSCAWLHRGTLVLSYSWLEFR